MKNEIAFPTAKHNLSEIHNPTHVTTRTGFFASLGALVAAVFSSACCWLPLIAIGLGASSASVGAFFAAWRIPLLMATIGLQGTAFYFVYRKPRCTPRGTCESPNTQIRRFNRVMLWSTTVLIVAFTFFPEYINIITDDSDSDRVVSVSPYQTIVKYKIKGMTCAGCVSHARSSIQAIPDVTSAVVSYHDGSAEVAWSSTPDDAAIFSALAALGYLTTREP